MNKILKLNLLYYVSFIILAISRIIKGNSIIDNTLIPLLIILISYIMPLIYYKIIKKEESNFNIINTTLPVLNLICYFLTENPILSIIIISILSLLSLIIKVNYISIYYLLVLIICQKLNIDYYEESSIIYTIICYVILMFNQYYKREIPLFIINSYVITALLLYVCNIGDVTALTNKFLSSDMIYLAVLVASFNEYSPMTFIGKVAYSFIIGISSCLIINLTNCSYVIYIIIIILNIFMIIQDKCTKVKLKNTRQ